jgi:hypothetical protein
MPVAIRAFEKTECFERLQQTECGRARNADALGQLGRAEHGFACRELGKNAQAAFEAGDEIRRAAAGFLFGGFRDFRAARGVLVGRCARRLRSRRPVSHSCRVFSCHVRLCR